MTEPVYAYYGFNGCLNFIRLEPNGIDIPTFWKDGIMMIIHPITKKDTPIKYS